MQVYKYLISEKESGLSFSGIIPQELPDETAAHFKFDKIIRIDCPDEKLVVFMSDEEQRMEDFANGVAAYYWISKQGVGKLKTEENGSISLVDKDGKEILPVIRKCSICNNNMEIRKYFTKNNEPKYYDFCPTCDGDK